MHGTGGMMTAASSLAVTLHLQMAGMFAGWALHIVLCLDAATLAASIELRAWNRTCSASSCQPSTNETATEEAMPRHLVEIPTGYIISGARHSLLGGQAGTMAAMLYAPMEDLLITGGDSGDVQFWKGEDAAVKSIDTALYAQTAAGAPVTALTYIPGDQSIAVARDDGYIRFLRVSDRGILGEIQENNRQGLITSIEHLEYNDDVLNYVEVATSSTSPVIKLFDVQTRTMSRAFTGHKRPVLTLRFLPPHEMLVSGGFDGLVCFWSLPVATRLAVGKRCIGQKTYLSTAYRERDCLASTISQGGTFFIYGLQDGPAANSCEMELSDCSLTQDADYALFRIEQPSRFKLPGHDGAVRAIEYVSDGELAASGGDDGKIQLWDPKKGELVRTLQVPQAPTERVLALLYVSTLRVLIAGTTNGIVFFDANSGGAALTSRPLSSQVASLSYLKVGPHQLIATAQSELIDVLLALEICVDGKRPRSPAACELCPWNLAGENGICQIPCRSGLSSNENRTICVPCQPGSGGVDGFCELCAPGRFQDKPGRLSCTPCTKGYAQPLRGQTSCAACVDNTVSEVDGQANCIECPDGKEPSRDQSRCQACPEGTAGNRGLCFQCRDGQQPNTFQSACINCITGTAGTMGSCTRCADGMQPAEGLTECEACPLGEAGRKGSCTRCVPGQTPEPGSAFCMNCPPGEAGTNGTCTACTAGYVPVEDRTSCEECPDKQPSFRGNCLPCADGTEPAENRTACLPCARGEAGKGGICSRCKAGGEASEDKSRCVPCDETSASSAGVCEPCPDGTQPNQNKTVCEPCEPGTAGRGGRCTACGDGLQQNDNRSVCEECPLGRAGVLGICEECGHPKMQNGDRTACTVRPLPPYFVFFNPRCSGHPMCRSHFAHTGGDFFCCPTPDGDNLDCCQFETETTRKGWIRLATLLSRLVRLVSRAVWLFPVLSVLTLVPIGCFMYRVKTHEDWEDWRENLRTTRFTVFCFFTFFPAFAVIVPWVMLTLVLLGWQLIVIFFLYTQFFLLMTRSTAYLHYERPLALARMRKWWIPIFIAKVVCEMMEFVHNWLLLHFFWMSMIGFLFGTNKPIAFEQVVAFLALPGFFQYFLDWLIYLMRGPQVILSSILVHINIHTDNFTVTLFAAAAFTLTVVTGSYVLLAGDVLGRLTSAKQGILLSYTSGKAKVQLLAIYGIVDWFFTLFLNWSALCSACLVPQLLMLAPEGKGPQYSTAGIARGSAWFLILMVQLAALGMWIAIAGGAHLDNPPPPLCRWLRRICGVQFQALRREQFIIRSVLRGLGLHDLETEGPEVDFGSEAPSGSPRSSVSPRSPNGSPRSRSPRSPRSGASSPKDGHSQRETAAATKKVLKNFGSVRRLLRQLDPTLEEEGSPRSVSELGIDIANSPSASPRSARSRPTLSPGRRKSGVQAVDRVAGAMSPGASSRGALAKSAPAKLASQMGANSCRKPVNFVRLPDGTHASLIQGSPRRGDRSSPETASPNISGRASPSPGQSGRASIGRATTRGDIASPSSHPASPSRMSHVMSDGSGAMSPTSGRKSMASPIYTSGDGSSKGHERSVRGSRLARSTTSLVSSESSDSSVRCGCLGRCCRRLRRALRCRRLGRCLGRVRDRCCCKKRQVEEDGTPRTPRMKVSYDIRKSREVLSLEKFDLLESKGEGGTADLTEFTLTPQQLYEKMPKPLMIFTCQRLMISIRRSLRTCWSVCMGQWKDSWNISPLRLRLRTRDYAKEVWRKNYDQEDYKALEYATARTIACSTLALPGGALLWATALFLNRPVFRHYDDKLDIIQHKVEEYVDRGVSHKQAMITITRKLVSTPENRWRKKWLMRCHRIIFLLNVALLCCLLAMACAVSGDNAFWLLPPFSLVAIMSIIARTAVETLAIPALMLPQTIHISVRREMDDEKAIIGQVQDAIGSEESSETEESLSDYSSANESFLDEDPNSQNGPSVLGVKNAKVIVRPKASRLKLRFKLQECIPAYSAHMHRWRHEDPLKHCPLLQVPGAYRDSSPKWNNCGGYALRRERTFSFQPTEASDWPLKVQRFGLTRCKSLGTITAREEYAFRQQYERWYGWMGIFEERALSGLPSLPHTNETMPYRGLADEFEEQLVFAKTQEVTNKQLAFANPFTDTRAGRGFTRAKHFIMGLPAPPKPKWEMSYDEELARSTDSVTAFIETQGLRELMLPAPDGLRNAALSNADAPSSALGKKKHVEKAELRKAAKKETSSQEEEE